MLDERCEFSRIAKSRRERRIGGEIVASMRRQFVDLRRSEHPRRNYANGNTKRCKITRGRQANRGERRIGRGMRNLTNLGFKRCNRRSVDDDDALAAIV